mgnify:CR=1 FL=1
MFFRRAHPRAGGENLSHLNVLTLRLGSSPRGRGKRPGVVDRDLNPRLIPARAGKTVSPPPQDRQAPAHPRAGGENFGRRTWGTSPAGSSPRGRGKRWQPRPGASERRLIPARAGKTRGVHVCAWRGAAHPRAGGENDPHVIGLEQGRGSSPRGRGKHALQLRPALVARLIPARAGKTEQKARGCPSWTAHPRAGGENAVFRRADRSPGGSSPRGRGKRQERCDDAINGRLIPARAGKTPGAVDPRFQLRAHPRAGGENIPSKFRPSREQGSSPRGRGKLRRVRTSCWPRGLIPARAGKTSGCVLPGSNWAAHPRAGGENAARDDDRLPRGGSSPRGRGKHGVYFPSDDPVRLIPARAGKTSRPLLRSRRPRAHPRAGGENRYPCPRQPRAGGSSPRGRGKRRAAAPVTVVPRLIPARAGKTCAHLEVRLLGRAHPRAGGENLSSSSPSRDVRGSSPRGRGKRNMKYNSVKSCRLIPARAGKTRPSVETGSSSAAHPRAGGENCHNTSGQATPQGSSPRGRGKP